MFTHVVDDAINRFEYKGLEVAVTYDDDSYNPLDNMGVQGFAIRSHERNTIDYDPCEVLKDYEDWAESKDRELVDIEITFDMLRERYGKTWWECIDDNDDYYTKLAQDVIDNIGAIDNYNGHLERYELFEYTAYDEYGHPQYTVVVDMPWFKLSWGPSSSEYKDIALSLAKEYAAWANGSVYVIGLDRGDDKEESLVCNVIGIDPYDNEALIEFVENHFVC